MTLRLTSEPKLALQFLVAVTDVDSLWNQFKLEDDIVLDCLVQFVKTDDYLVELPSKIQELIIKYKVMVDNVRLKGVETIDMQYIQNKLLSTETPTDDSVKPFSRLPEIPLPKFNGDFGPRFGIDFWC